MKVEPEDPVRARQVEAQQLCNHADHMRALFERDRRPGPLAEEKAAKDFQAVVEAYRLAIDRDPRGPNATYGRQRLAGAYTYVGDFEAGLRVLVEAVNVAAGAEEQIVACHGAGLHCLQALHRPAEALRWFRRAEVLVGKIEDEPMRAKWAVATREGIARCEAEMK